MKGTHVIWRKANPHDLQTHNMGAKESFQPTFSAGFSNNRLCSNINQHDLFISSVYFT